MSEERPEIDLPRHEYRRAFDRPLASPKHLRWSLLIFMALSLAAACAALWFRELWWAVFVPIGPALWAGAALAGLWPNFFFGPDPRKDDFT